MANTRIEVLKVLGPTYSRYGVYEVKVFVEDVEVTPISIQWSLTTDKGEIFNGRNFLNSIITDDKYIVLNASDTVLVGDVHQELRVISVICTYLIGSTTVESSTSKAFIQNRDIFTDPVVGTSEIDMNEYLDLNIDLDTEFPVII